MGTNEMARTPRSGARGPVRELEVGPRLIGSFSPNPRNSRTHSKKQIRQIAESIRTFGFTNPVLIDDADGIIAGQAGSQRRSSSACPRCR